MKKKEDKQQEHIVNEEFLEDQRDTKEMPADEALDCKPGCEECCEADGSNDLSSGPARELDELRQKLNEAEKKRDEYLAMAQRVQADFENYKRRNKNIVADTYANAASDILTEFLPVLDNLDRAIASFKDAQADESMVKGVEMIHKQLVSCLGKQGVEEIEALGMPFDPELHEAVMQSEAEDGQEPNTVAEVLQKGYRTKDRILRYSMVRVAK